MRKKMRTEVLNRILKRKRNVNVKNFKGSNNRTNFTLITTFPISNVSNEWKQLEQFTRKISINEHKSLVNGF